jgi:hypothetical protein
MEEAMRTEERSRTSGGGLLAFAVVVFGVMATIASLWWAAPWQSSLLRVNRFMLVQPGMTRAEVEALLGGPPGDYGFHQGGPVSEVKAEDWPADPNWTILTWFNDEAKLEIAFDAQGKVASKIRQPAFLRTPPKISWRYWWNCFIK